MKLNMKNLEDCYSMAISLGYRYVAVLIQMEGFKKHEIIINSKENFDENLKYYQRSYNDDLVLKSYSGIRIVGFTMGDSLADIESSLSSLENKEN